MRGSAAAAAAAASSSSEQASTAMGVEAAWLVFPPKEVA